MLHVSTIYCCIWRNYRTKLIVPEERCSVRLIVTKHYPVPFNGWWRSRRSGPEEALPPPSRNSGMAATAFTHRRLSRENINDNVHCADSFAVTKCPICHRDSVIGLEAGSGRGCFHPCVFLGTPGRYHWRWIMLEASLHVLVLIPLLLSACYRRRYRFCSTFLN